MKIKRGIAVTDALNLYNEKFTLEAMYGAYEKQWNEFVPFHVNHNHEISIGRSKLSGIYLQSGKAYLTNENHICETKEEAKQINQLNKEYMYQVHIEANIDNYMHLLEKMKNYLQGEHVKYWVNGAFIYNKGIVTRAFPKLAEKIEDGLIDLKLLSPVLPGIYKIDEYLIFAHKYFRRGYSYLNTLNSPFLATFENLKSENQNMKIAIDLDCIGLAGTEHKEHEYQYWWGPKFNNDLASIPLGVTVFENEDFDELFSEIRRTEFGWYIQDEKHTFECEEITDVPNLFDDGSSQYACRFVHSMVDNKTNLPDHLDGAIRAYTDEKMIRRIDISIKDSNRDTLYTKIWRVDGTIPIEKWKELISHYFKDNQLVGEYFGAVDNKISNTIESKEQDSINKQSIKNYIPCNINSNDGIQINFSFSRHANFDEDYDVIIRPSSYMPMNGALNKYIESASFSLFKLLRRNGLKLRFPFVRQVSFYDTVYNFSIFECKDIEVADQIIKLINSLCQKWSSNGNDRIISFTIKIPYDMRDGVFSFLGHVNDFARFFNDGFASIPSSENIFDWLSKAYEYISNNFNQTGTIHPFDTLMAKGVLSAERRFISPKSIKKLFADGHADLVIDKDSLSFIQANNITPVVALCDERVTCSKCNKSYQDCGCIRFFDEDVAEIIEEATPIGLTWTNRSAFVKIIHDIS